MADRRSGYGEITVETATVFLTFDDIPRQFVEGNVLSTIDVSGYLNQGTPETTDFSVAVPAFTTFSLNDSNDSAFGVTRKDNRIVVADGSGRLFFYTRGGTYLPTESFNTSNGNDSPRDVYFDPIGRRFYVLDRQDDAVYVYDEFGSYITHWSLVLNNAFPSGLTRHKDWILVMDQARDSVFFYTLAGVSVQPTEFVTSYQNPTAVTSANGLIWVLQRNANEAVITPYDDSGNADTTQELSYTPFAEAEGVAFWNNTFLLVQNGDPGTFAFIDYFAITASIADATQIVSINPAITPNVDIDADLILTAHQPSVGDITTTLPIRIGTAPVWGSIGVFNATESVSWSYDVTNIDITGSAPITYRLGTAPSWVSFAGTTLSGTPPNVDGDQSYTIEVIAENTLGSDTGDFVVSVPDDSTQPPVWTPVATLTFRTDMPNSFDLNNFVTGIPTPTIAIQSGTLQTGITLINGVLSGIPTDIVNRSVTFRATNSDGTADEQINVNVLQPPVWATVPDQAFTVGDTVNLNLNIYATGFPTPNITATNLPAGLSVNSSGFLVGTPTAIGTDTVTVIASNGGGSGQTMFDVTVESAGVTRFYLVHFTTARLRVFAPDGTEDTGLRIDLGIDSPGGFEYNGNFYLVETNPNRLHVFAPDGTEDTGLRIDLGTGTWTGGFEYNGNFYLVNFSDRLRVFAPDGTEDTGLRIDLGLSDWRGGFEYNGNFYLVDNFSDRLRVFAPDGTEGTGLRIDLGTGAWQDGFEYNGNFYLVDLTTARLRVFAPDGTEDTGLRIDLGTGAWTGGFKYAS